MLPTSLLDLFRSADANKPVGGLELLHGLVRVVHQRETGALAATVLRAEAEDGHLVFVGLVQVGDLVAEFVFGDVGAVGVEDVPTSLLVRWLLDGVGVGGGRTQPSASGQAGGCG